MYPVFSRFAGRVAVLFAGSRQRFHSRFFDSIPRNILVTESYAEGDFCTNTLDQLADQIVQSRRRELLPTVPPEPARPFVVVTSDTMSTIAMLRARRAANLENDFAIVAAVIGN